MSFVEQFVKSTGGSTAMTFATKKATGRDELMRLALQHYEAAARASDPNIAAYHVYAGEDAGRNAMLSESGLRS